MPPQLRADLSCGQEEHPAPPLSPKCGQQLPASSASERFNGVGHWCSLKDSRIRILCIRSPHLCSVFLITQPFSTRSGGMECD